MSTLEVKNLSIRVGDFQIIHDIDFSLKDKAVTSIVGPSGCGKSTFLRSINRMHDLNPDFVVEGNILINGDDINTAETDLEALRTRVGMVFQKANPFPMSIIDNIRWGLKIHGKDKVDQRAEAALRDVALWDEVKNRLDESALRLSGGQQQRLCIARALALEPELLLLDEPCSALDPISTHKIEELIEELSAKLSILIVTHNLAQARRVSTNCAVFYDGRVIDHGPFEELSKTPNDKRTFQYLNGQIG